MIGTRAPCRGTWRGATTFQTPSLTAGGRDADPGRRSLPTSATSISRKIARARSDKGTRCSRAAFVRAGGTVQTFWSRSISVPSRSQRLSGSRRRQDAELERTRCYRRPLTKLGDERGHVGVGHCGVMAARQLGTLRQKFVEMTAPACRIGFVAADEAARSAASRTDSIRPRKRDPVSGARIHKGLRTDSTASVSTAVTGMSRIGSQYRVKVIAHWALCLGFLHSAPRASRKSSAILPNVGISFAPGVFQREIGSTPSSTHFRPFAAFSRASFRDTPPLPAGPRPASRILPCHVKRKTHRRRPPLEIERYNPPPSACRPGFEIVSAARADSSVNCSWHFVLNSLSVEPVGPNSGPNILMRFGDTSRDVFGRAGPACPLFTDILEMP